jgi:predicted nucleic-acid-binding protein
MKAVDTNVLIRFLVRDDEQQAESIYRIFKQAESDKESLFVPLLGGLRLKNTYFWNIFPEISIS